MCRYRVIMNMMSHMISSIQACLKQRTTRHRPTSCTVPALPWDNWPLRDRIRLQRTVGFGVADHEKLPRIPFIPPPRTTPPNSKIKISKLSLPLCLPLPLPPGNKLLLPPSLPHATQGGSGSSFMRAELLKGAAYRRHNIVRGWLGAT